MCTTDAFQGFRKLMHFPTVALAVSQSNVVVAGKVYDAPEGWHWATQAEVEAVPGWGAKPGSYNYYNQGGWQSYVWKGVRRDHFLFREGGSAAILVGLWEGMIPNKSASGGGNKFAGIVCMPD
jgi:hypothetical protein